MVSSGYLFRFMLAVAAAPLAMLIAPSGCESSGSAGVPGTGGRVATGGVSGTGGSTTVVAARADAGFPCTPVADVDCAKVGKAFDTVCPLGCASLVMCDETTGPALEAACSVAKGAGDKSAAGLACLYTNPKSCEDLNSCLRACDR